MPFFTDTKDGLRTVRVWRYNAAANVWGVVRYLSIPDSQPYPTIMAARTNLDAFVGYSSSGRIDWFHTTAQGLPIWEQKRWGGATEQGTADLKAVPQAPGVVLALVVAEEMGGVELRLFRRYASGAWAKLVRLVDTAARSRLCTHALPRGRQFKFAGICLAVR